MGWVTSGTISAWRFLGLPHYRLPGGYEMTILSYE